VAAIIPNASCARRCRRTEAREVTVDKATSSTAVEVGRLSKAVVDRIRRPARGPGAAAAEDGPDTGIRPPDARTAAGGGCIAGRDPPDVVGTVPELAADPGEGQSARG
jgi:hypothetical protein